MQAPLETRSIQPPSLALDTRQSCPFPNSPRVPIEILDIIVTLVQESKDAHAALRSISLVSSHWHDAAGRYLYEKFSIGIFHKIRFGSSFVNVLHSASTRIESKWIRSLVYSISVRDGPAETWAPFNELLRTCTQLNHLDVSGWGDWPHEIQLDLAVNVTQVTFTNWHFARPLPPMPSVVSLDLHQITDSSKPSVFTLAFPSVTQLTYSSHLHSPCLSTPEICPLLALVPQLSHLSITRTVPLPLLLIVLSSSPLLTHLSIHRFDNPTPHLPPPPPSHLPPLSFLKLKFSTSGSSFLYQSLSLPSPPTLISLFQQEFVGLTTEVLRVRKIDMLQLPGEVRVEGEDLKGWYEGMEGIGRVGWYDS